MKTIKKTNSGKNELRLVDMGKAFVGLAVSANDKIVAHVEGSDADDVWRRLHDEAAKSGAAYIGFEGARNRFLHFFPNGFRSAGFVSQERQYKLNAKAKLEQSAPLEKAATGTGLGPDILRAYQTNMLSQHELMRLRDLLHGKDADAFVQMAAAFAKGDMSVLSTLSKLLKPYECAKWTVVTYPAFLWLPEKNMFLKPEATRTLPSGLATNSRHTTIQG